MEAVAQSRRRSPRRSAEAISGVLRASGDPSSQIGCRETDVRGAAGTYATASMERDSGSLTPAFHGCRSAVRADCAPPDAWASSGARGFHGSRWAHPHAPAGGSGVPLRDADRFDAVAKIRLTALVGVSAATNMVSKRPQPEPVTVGQEVWPLLLASPGSSSSPVSASRADITIAPLNSCAQQREPSRRGAWANIVEAIQ